MISKFSKKMLLLGVIGLFLIPLTFTSVTIGMNPIDNPNLSIMGVDTYFEDFTTTTNRAGTTSAFGWGSGYVSNARNFTVTTLDYELTPHPVTSIAVQGRKLYIGMFNPSIGVDIACYDINNPRNIRFLSERDTLTKTYTIAVDGDTLFTGRDSNLQSFNTYNVQDPFGLGAGGAYMDYTNSDGFITDIEIEGHLTYHANYGSTSNRSFVIVDASDRNSLREIPQSWESNNTLGLDVNGQLAYLAASIEGLYIVNITDKFLPVEVGFTPIPGNATDVLVDGSLAYVTAGTEGLFIVDVVNPASPTVIGHLDTPGKALRLAKKGSTIYIADGAAGVTVVDVANPIHPLFVHNISPLPFAWDVDLYGGDLVVGTNNGIYTYRVGYLGNFAVDWYDSPLQGITPYDIRVQGDIAYIAAGINGLYTVDVSNPREPVILDNYYVGPTAFLDALDVYGQYVIAIYESGICTFDVSDPGDIQLTRFEVATDFEDIVMHGPIGYAAFGDPGVAGIATYNYTYGFGSAFSSNIFYGTNVSTIDAQGEYVFTAENTGINNPSPYLHTLDPTPLNPILTGSYGTLLQLALDIRTDGDLVFISDTNYLAMLNISTPTTPAWYGDIWNGTTNPIDSRGVWTDGVMVVSASGAEGVYLINTTGYLNHPTMVYSPVTNCPNVNRAEKIVIHGDHTYVANETSLVILRHFKSLAANFIPGTHIAESTEVDVLTNGLINSATLNVEDHVPLATAIDYYMSADGGAHWDAVAPGVTHEFLYPGEELLWRAEIIGPEDKSAYIYELSIDYEYNEGPSTPAIEELGNKFIGLFSVKWSESTDDVEVVNYELEMSDSSGFGTILKNWTTTSTSKSVSTGSGEYYFRVRAIDNEGVAGDWSVQEQATVTLSTLVSFLILGGMILLIIILVVVIVVVVRRKKKTPTR